MSKEKLLPESNEKRFLDLGCIPDFKIEAVEKEIKTAYMQKAKQILDEILADPTVKGEIRKKILKCSELLEDKC